MPRNMSFSMTTQQFRDRTKTVTRRFGWWSVKAGDILCGVEKAMGLRKGEKVNRLGLIEVVSARNEHLDAITQADVVAEGFPEWTRRDFVEFFARAHRCKHNEVVRRIEFRYLDPAPEERAEK